jgi:hypothetical protein
MRRPTPGDALCVRRTQGLEGEPAPDKLLQKVSESTPVRLARRALFTNEEAG